MKHKILWKKFVDSRFVNSWDELVTRIMGLVMGAIATGVLIGYPMGGILFDFVGESCPFIVIVVATSITLGNSIFQ